MPECLALSLEAPLNITAENPGFELIDIGANLAHDSFDADRDAVIARAALRGVTRIVVTGSTADSSRDAAVLADAWPGRLFATAGIHPHHAREYSESVERVLLELTEKGSVVAIGECGLDYFRDFSPRDAQRRAFAAQLELAASSRLPVFLHQREAHDDFLDMLTPMMSRISRGVAHCFTGDDKALRDYLDLGLYIGVTGWICDERRGAKLRDAVREIPLDRLMIETDAPYLLPRTLRPRPRSRRNEPMHLREVLRVVAEAMGRTEEDVAQATAENSARFFALPPHPAAG